MKSLCFCGDEAQQPGKGLSLLSRILLSIPEMLFVMISCADDMSWMCGSSPRACFHGANEIAAPIRFGRWDTNIIRSGRRASFSLGIALVFQWSSMNSDTALNLPLSWS
jgi:hypothetical protein